MKNLSNLLRGSIQNYKTVLVLRNEQTKNVLCKELMTLKRLNFSS